MSLRCKSTHADVHRAKQQVAMRGDVHRVGLQTRTQAGETKQSPHSLQLECLRALVCSASVHREPYCVLFGDANKDHLAGFPNHVSACSDLNMTAPSPRAHHGRARRQSSAPVMQNQAGKVSRAWQGCVHTVTQNHSCFFFWGVNSDRAPRVERRIRCTLISIAVGQQ